MSAGQNCNNFCLFSYFCQTPLNVGLAPVEVEAAWQVLLLLRGCLSSLEPPTHIVPASRCMGKVCVRLMAIPAEQ